VMRTTLAFVVTALVAALGGVAGATPGTCTIIEGGLSVLAHVPSAGDFEFPIMATGVAIPMDIDVAAGTVTVTRDSLPELTFGTQGGGVKVQLAGAPVTGTIDGAGNVSLPHFDMTMSLGPIALPIAPTLSTGTESQTLSGVEYADHGAPLDFTTGQLTLLGADVIPNAPIVEMPVVSGIRLTCRLDPVPGADQVPAGPKVKVNGQAKINDAGDTLHLKARLSAGAAGLDLSTGDVFVRIAQGNTDVLVVVVHRSALKGKGHKFKAKDTDGTAVVVASGRDAATGGGGAITITGSKKHAAINLRLTGLDLANLSSSSDVTVTIGQDAATSAVSVVAHGAKRTLH